MLSDSAFTQLCDELRHALGPDAVSTDPADCGRHAGDWSGLRLAEPRAVVRPRATEGVAAAVRLCAAAGQPLVVQGGRTGLAGGAAAQEGEVALSLERLVGVEAIDPAAATITVKAGTTLAAVQAAAEDAGLFYAVDIGARGSCTIGGMIATNAGGIRVIRYGMTRRQVLGLEAVLADGTILSDMSGMLKNNTGFDLKQLFIGAEGALGVVTRAVLRLQPQPTARATAWLVLADEDALVPALSAARARLGSSLAAFEAMWPDYLSAVTARAPHYRSPFSTVTTPAVLIDVFGDDPTTRDAALRERLESFLTDALEQGWLTDAVIAESLDQARRLWAIRDEAPAEYATLFRSSKGFDVSIPISRMTEAVRVLRTGLAERVPDAAGLFYGHLGDANLHLVVGFDTPVDEAIYESVEDLLYETVRTFSGSVSAEHGIGLLKRRWLGFTRSESEIATMRRLKDALDPSGILNPGRVVEIGPSLAGA
jgi:FAD/FMN-containing dehydrogenase